LREPRFGIFVAPAEIRTFQARGAGMPSTDALRFPLRGVDAHAASPARQAGIGDAVTACLRQWRAERALESRGVNFRSTDPEVVANAYSAMDQEEFEAINCRQEWANWRTIPAALDDRLPKRRILAADLGCGTGTSTRVLAQVCPEGSTILGYEYAAPLVAHARRRHYLHASGRPARVTFVCQGVAESLRWPGGGNVEDGAFELVNASGIIGHHFRLGTIRPVLHELKRAVAPGGFALLDDGPTLPASVLERLMRAVGFLPLGRYRSWLLASVGQTLFVKLSTQR